jgi:hypothetical protein
MQNHIAAAGALAETDPRRPQAAALAGGRCRVDLAQSEQHGGPGSIVQSAGTSGRTTTGMARPWPERRKLLQSRLREESLGLTFGSASGAAMVSDASAATDQNLAG